MDYIEKVSAQQIKRDLYPVLRKVEKFDLEREQKGAKDYLASIMILTEEENFWKEFEKEIIALN